MGSLRSAWRCLFFGLPAVVLVAQAQPVPEITQQPQSQFVQLGSNAVFHVTAAGQAPLHHNWWRQTPPPTDWIALSDGGSISGADTPTLTLSGARLSDQANYRCVVHDRQDDAVTSDIATLTIVYPPTMAVQPIGQVLDVFQSFVLETQAEGTAPLFYRWNKDGVPIADDGRLSGTATSTLTVSNATGFDAGDYTLAVSNAFGSTTSQGALVTVADPRIVSQPTGTNVRVGVPVQFVVDVIGSEPLSYQWFKDGLPLSDGTRLAGANTPALSVHQVGAADDGEYAVVVSNTWMSVTSAAVRLSVLLTRYVDVNNPSPIPPYTNWTCAANVIQDAVDVANPGDTVLVTNGFYEIGGKLVHGGTTNRVAVDKPLNLMSVNGPQFTRIGGRQVPGSLTGSNAVRCVYLTNGACLLGFTLTNGGTLSTGVDVFDRSGGGLWCESAGAMISNCVFVGNAASAYGGGAYRGTLVGCTFTENVAWTGAGANAAALSGCTLSNNAASYRGGGAQGGSLSDCRVTANTADYGAGTWGSAVHDCHYDHNTANLAGGGAEDGVISNSLFETNRAQYGGAVSHVDLTDSLLSGNWAGRGGGACLYGTLYRCTLVGNSCDQDGGGAYYGSLRTCTLIDNKAFRDGGGAYQGSVTNSVFQGNWARRYGGGTAYGTVQSCTLTGCSAETAGGTYLGFVRNCIIYFNTASLESDNYVGAGPLYYCCTTPPPPGGYYNVSADPQLASLSHLSAGSPCLEAGLAALVSGTDYDGDAWRSPPSIGCDEYWAGATTGALSATIEAAYTNLAVGYPVAFTAWIQGRATASAWDFGDGTVVSNQPYVSHGWSAPGEYPVVLTAYNDTWPGGVSATTMVQVSEQPVHLVSLGSVNPAPPYTSWAAAARNIQDAVDVAAPGALILVTNGVYSTGTRVVDSPLANRVAIVKPLSVQSVNGPESTFIHGEQVPETVTGGGAVRCVYLADGARLRGFTVTGGATGDSGAIQPQRAGGGVYGESTNATVVDCILENNVADSNGGGANQVTLINCVLRDNIAYGSGGGASFSTLQTCTVVDNTAAAGGGVSDCVATNCIVYFNTGDLPAMVNHVGGSLNYSCTTPAPTNGVGNLTNNPVFVDRTGGDLALLATSPCVNAGHTASVNTLEDLEGQPRVVGGIVDMGAYESSWPLTVRVEPPATGVVLNTLLGLHAVVNGEQPQAFQWLKDNVPLVDGGRITGAQSSVLILTNVVGTDAGAYRVLVSNSWGVATSEVATVTVLFPPSISDQPVGRTVSAGSDVGFSVEVSGTPPFTYQWRKNGAVLIDGTKYSGARSADLLVSNVWTNDAGNYDVIVGNAYGGSTSAPGALIVSPSPWFAGQPESLVASIGQNVVWQGEVLGEQPLYYQWQFDGADLVGQTNSTLTLAGVGASAEGDYRLVASNALGAAFSVPATLSVVPVALWGRGENGQLPTGAASTIPADATNIVAIDAVGYPEAQASLVVRADGTLLQWGFGYTDPSETATNVVAVGIGEAVRGTPQWLAARMDGSVVGWGKSVLGTSVPPPGATNVVAVAGGAYQSLALRSDGSLVSWGSTAYGLQSLPPGTTNIVAIAAGAAHSLALRADGRVFGWGFDALGQATALTGETEIVAISAQGNQSLGLRRDGTLVGLMVTNDGASLAFGAPPPSATNLAIISAGVEHTIAVRRDGTVVCFGSSSMGQADPPAFLTNVVALAAGRYHSLALVRDADRPIPPYVARQPMSRTVKAGESIVVHALALGSPPVRYHWRHHDAWVPGQTNAWLYLANVHPRQAGDYAAVATNEFGTVTSAVAMVTVELTAPRLRWLEIATNGFRFTFESIVDVLYVSEYRDAVTPGAWTELERRCGVGGTEVVTDPEARNAARFYRVRAVYAPSPQLSLPTQLGNTVGFGFPTVLGAQYIVEYRDSLTDGAWIELERLDGTGGMLQIHDPGPLPARRYYRVRVR